MKKKYKVKLIAWAQAKKDVGFESIEAEFQPGETPEELFNRLGIPTRVMDYCKVAIDMEFSDWNTPLNNTKEIAIIPPVSGG